MAKKLSTCYLCKKSLLPDEKVKYKLRNYCIDCRDKLKAEDKENEKKELSDYALLIDAICKYFKIKEPTGIIISQIKNFKTKYNQTYAGMTYTLWYLTSVLNKRLDLTYGIALVRYHYEEAKNYYTLQAQLKSLEEKKTLTPNPDEQKVNVVCKKSQPLTKHKLLIDLSQFCTDEGEMH